MEEQRALSAPPAQISPLASYRRAAPSPQDGVGKTKMVVATFFASTVLSAPPDRLIDANIT